MTATQSQRHTQQIMRHHKKIIKDLEKIYQQALNDKSFMAALKAKELQLKEMRGLLQHQTISPPTKYTSVQDLVHYFSQYTTDELTTLDRDLLSLTESSHIK